MKTRRTGSLLLVGLLAAAATLLLTAGLAAAQPEAGTPPLLSPDDVSLPRVADDPARTVAEQAQPGWAKWVNGVSWKPGMTITVETSDTIEIVDAVTTLPSEPLDLAETWDHLHLKLLGYQVQAPFPGWAVITDTGALVWQLPEGGQVFTMTKWFHVEPCTWGETELVETLSGASQSTVRPVIIEKRAPMLWIGSEYQPGVIAGEGAQFALRYGNDGGYENGVWVRNEFPPEAPFAWSDPPPDEGGAGDFSVGWRVGDLAMGSTGEIVVGVSITAGLPVSTEIPTWDCILDHTGEPRDEVISVFHVQETPPQVVWHKLVNDVPWDPELLVTAVTSDTIEVVDMVEILIPTAFTLIEEWDPAHLELLDAIPSLGKVVTGMGTLEWTVPEPFESPITAELVKRFHVGPGPWDATVLEEALIVPGAEPMVRVVPIAHRYPPVVFPEGPWPWYAQDEISVYPEPPLAGQPTEICAQVVNVDPLHAHWALLEFAIADFGIGLPFEAIDAVEVIVPPGGEATGCIVWVPPEPRKWCIEVRLINEGFEPLISRRNVDADEPLMPNMPHELIFPVANPLGEMVTIDLFMVPHIDWGMAISPTKLVNIEPGETRPVSLIVTPTENMPADGHPVVDVEARVGDELIGGFRKLFRPLIVLHPFPDPPYAEREISVHPYPPLAGQPTEVCVELRNPTDVAHDVQVQFSWAAFGIGLPFTPIDGLRPVHLPPHSVVKECIHWIPPVSGHVCLQVELLIFGYEPQRSQRNLDVNEPLRPHIPHSTVFEVRNSLTRTVDIEMALIPHLPNWRIEIEPPVLPSVEPGLTRTVTLTVIPPEDLPPDGTPVVDVEARADGQLIGGIRKVFRPPIILHPFPDPSYAEREISVHPYPPLAGQPTEICVELRNPSPYAQEVMVQFSWAAFGIGLPFTPIDGLRPVYLPPYSVVKECIHWVPPISGHLCLQVELFVRGYEPQRSQRNLDVAEPLQSGIAHSASFVVRNPLDHAADIHLGLVPHLPGWQIEIEPPVLPSVEPGFTRTVTLTVIPPGDLPEDGAPVVDVEAYADGRLIGGIRKVFRPPIILHPFPDPPYAEREISVYPYPPLAGQPTEVCVELRNPTPYPQDVAVQFSWAAFGIGIPFTPIDGLRPVHLPPFSIVKECIHWVPPIGGHVCLQVELLIDGYPPQRSQRNLDVAEPLQSGIAHSASFVVRNPLDHAADIHLGLVPHLPGWQIEIEPPVLPSVEPGLTRTVTLTVIPPGDLPENGQVVVDVEAYAEGRLIGGFRKLFRPPIVLHPFPDPPYAEREISVHPYPPLAGQPTEVCVELRNPTPYAQDVAVQFSWAAFGIGIPFTPIDGLRPVYLPPFSIVKECIHWVPPISGHVCLQVELLIDGYPPQRSQRNLDVNEPLRPHIPHSSVFEVRNSLTRTVDIEMALIPHLPNWRIEIEPPVLPSVEPGLTRTVTLTVIPPEDLPPDGTPVVDVEAYAEGRLIGGFRKLFRPPVPIHRPRDPVYAESEISIDPYPVLPGKSTKLGVEVFNPTPYDRVVEATFSVAPFGIGLPFKADGITPNPIMIYVPAHGAARGHVIWTPPPSVRGKVCVQVELEIDGHVMWSRRNIDVGEPLRPGIPHSMTFPVSTDTYTEPVTITLGVIRHKGEWDVSLSHETLTDVQPGETVPVTLTVTPPFTVTLGSGEPIADVEAYVEGRLLGGFRKLDVPPIPLHKPHEKGYAESEIRIDPYPPREGEPTQVSVDVQNTSEQPMTVDLTFGWAKFGMGIPFTTTGVMPYTRSVTLSPEMTATASVTWIPQLSGVQCVRVLLDDPEGVYGRQESQRNVDVIEEPPCGETKVFSFTVYNDTPFSMTVDIGMVTFNVPANWVVTTVPSDTLELGPFSEGTVTVTVEIPCPETAAEWRAQREIAVLQQGSGGVPTIDVEGYAGGDLVGGIEIQFTSPLPAPSDLSATAISHAQIGLNWTDNSTDETAFHIERSPDGVDEWTEVAAVASDETSYSDGSLQCETTYYYRVRAFRSGDGVYSSYSDVASDTTGMCPPDPPTGVAASDGAYTDRVAVTWESVSGATEYEVYRATSAAGAKVFQASASMTTYDDTTATPGAVYTYWVTACNASGCSDYSAPDTGWRKLLAPAGVTASDGVYTDRVAVSWDSVSGASEYEVYRATSPIGTKFHIGTTSLTAYDDATGTAGATYSYWVKACSDPGCSDYSAPDTGWRALPAPTGLTATPVSRTQIDLSWTDNSADETAFHIERSLDGGTDWDEIAVVGADVTAYSDVDLDCGTEYAYRVRAYQSTNGVYSAYSDPATARTAVCSFDVYLPLITR